MTLPIASLRNVYTILLRQSLSPVIPRYGRLSHIRMNEWRPTDHVGPSHYFVKIIFLLTLYAAAVSPQLIASTIPSTTHTETYYEQTNDRTLTTPYQQLITFFGPQQFKISGQAGLTGTYIISTPGAYTLSDTIPVTTAVGQAISIQSSNVIVDLAGQTITFTPGGSAINGITIAANLSNIIIRNGIISNMNGNGILINSGCSNIRLKDLVISNCTLSGVTFAGTSGALTTNCSIKNCTIQQCNTSTANAYGLKLSFCDFFIAMSCSFFSNQATGAAFNSYGMYAISSKNGVFDACQSRSNTATTRASGFYLDAGCSHFLFKNCVAKTNSSTGTGATSIGNGFYDTGCSNNRFEQCTSANNSGAALGAGFYTQNCSYNYWLECTAHNNTNTGITGTVGGYGFLANTATCRGNIFDTCTALGNTGSTDTASFGCGFSIDASLGCTIKNCFSQMNSGISGTGIGIEIKAGAVRCCIQNNTVITNTSSLVGKAYGIWDVSNPSTTLIMSNFAFGNRDETATPTNQNYVTSYALANVVQSAAKTSLKTPVMSSFLNTDITP